MYSFGRPRLWLCSGAVAAALRITFRVVTADAAPVALLTADETAVSGEIPDPALDALIRRLAARVTASATRR
jgi:hypothetical protein